MTATQTPREEGWMFDLGYVGLGAAFFALSWALVRGTAALRGDGR